MDAQTGRIRAMVNSRLVFQEALQPGSTIKPFTTLAALRAGILDESSTMACPGKYKKAGYETHCTHLKLRPPFDPVHALAYSCNYFYAKVGENLSQTVFRDTLASYGFGSSTGSGDEREASGSLPTGPWKAEYALGDGGGTTVTPAQLLTAYTALVNGGRLFAAKERSADGFSTDLRRQIELEPAYRSLLLEGLRGAVVYGTAAKAGLASLPVYVFGKTGTSMPPDDYHTDGWFVGFVSSTGDTPKPDEVKTAILVFLKRARGVDAAEAARSILEAPGAVVGSLSEGAPSITANEIARRPEGTVRVRTGRTGKTVQMPIDDYVAGVLAAEGSTETEIEALKALAVISRTFALKNLGRHGRDDFDFCDNTHCERFVPVNDEARPEFSQMIHRAVSETSGQVLSDSNGKVADAYFSAACGGMTANIRTLWGNPPEKQLSGVRDQYCQGSEYDHWTDAIRASDLLRALREDPRTDPGAQLNDVRISKRDATGRAEIIEILGTHTRLVRGWDFKIIVGRTLGWNLLKSSRFEVARQGNSYVFRGSGFGHGLGLCQLGAHEMARRGFNYRQIITNYLPGTAISDTTALSAPSTVPLRSSVVFHSSDRTNASIRQRNQAAKTLGAEFAHAALFSGAGRLTMASSNFRASYPAATERRDVEQALRILESARSEFSRRLSSMPASGGEALREMELFVHETTGDFVGLTGQPPWVAAVTHGRRIEIQPLRTVARRGILPSTLRHEYAHVVIETLGHFHVARWLAEGAAIYLAGEGRAYSAVKASKISTSELNDRLERPASAQEMRELYAAAYRQVVSIVAREGECGLWRRIAGT
jgi:stage II sporulation protein D